MSARAILCAMRAASSVVEQRSLAFEEGGVAA